MSNRGQLGSLNHEDAIYPTTKLSMNVTREERHEWHSQQEPAEQEARTKLPHGSTLFGRNLPIATTTKSESRSCFALSRRRLYSVNPTQPLTSIRQFRSIQRQAAEYRARSAGRQLGAEILESSDRKPAKTVLLRSLSFSRFGNHSSSETKYTALEPRRKGGRQNLPASWQKARNWASERAVAG